MLVSYNDSMKDQFLVSCLLVTSLLFSSVTLSQPNQELISISDLENFDQRNIVIKKSNDQIININVLIADTNKKTKQGLMYIESLPENIGMLFIFKPARTVSMWMKNTPQSLDILFIQSDGKIINIVKNTDPYSLKSIASKGRVKWVLEVKAGFTDKQSVEVGDQLVL